MGGTVSFLPFKKGLPKKLIMKVGLFLVCLLIGVQADEYKMVKKWAKKIGEHHFMTSCMGEKTMMKMWKKVEETADECLQLEANFDIPLFDGDDGDMFDDNDINPFITSNQGFQTLPSTVSQQAVRLPQQQFFNPWQMWMFNPYLQAGGKVAQSYQYRYKRAADPPTEEELEAFKEKVMKAKQMKKDMIGNKTCVLSKCGALNKDLGINLKHFTEDHWNMIDPSEQPDPEFKSTVIEHLEMCYKMSQSIPQDILAKKGPLYEMFGRQMMFFKCKKKMVKACCVKKELKKWTEYLYGEMEPNKLRELGLPSDPYDAALMKWEIMDRMEEPSKKFVFESIFGM